MACFLRKTLLLSRKKAQYALTKRQPDFSPAGQCVEIGTGNGSLYYSPYYDVPGYCYGLCIDSGYIAATEAVEYIK